VTVVERIRLDKPAAVAFAGSHAARQLHGAATHGQRARLWVAADDSVNPRLPIQGGSAGRHQRLIDDTVRPKAPSGMEAQRRL